MSESEKEIDNRIADADGQAEHDAWIAADIMAECGEPANEEEREWGEQLIFKALDRGRKEVRDYYASQVP